MNVFVLSTGRCGSTTLYKFCKHITNYSSGHESRDNLDFLFKNNHIEIDNRLSWFLGRLDDKYGNDAIYVHLIRNDKKVAASYARRFYYKRGMSIGYKYHLLRTKVRKNVSDLEICLDYSKTVNSNITSFLKDKSNVCVIHAENFKEDVSKFWNFIEAKGDLDLALKELDVKYNPSQKSIFNKIKSFYLNNFFYK